MSILEGVYVGIPNLEEEIEKLKQIVKMSWQDLNSSSPGEQLLDGEEFLNFHEPTESHPNLLIPKVYPSPSGPPPLGPTPQDLQSYSLPMGDR